jgi:hypothetical protein
MPESKSHQFPYVEPPRHDELPTGTPAPAPEHADARAERTPDGRWVQGAARAQSAGGLTRRGKPRLTRTKLTKAASALHRTLCREVASSVGGGVCGVAASLFLRWAADKTELAEQAKARGDDDMFRKLSESARMDVLYAREHAAKEAAARPKVRKALPWDDD